MLRASSRENSMLGQYCPCQGFCPYKKNEQNVISFDILTICDMANGPIVNIYRETSN